MTSIDILRNNIISKLLAIRNKEYLAALYQLLSNSAVEEEVVQLTEEQKLMLAMSDKDIEEGNLTPQSQLDKEDLEWLQSL